ncbi:hypothetical protein DPMN_187866 [Dreissena polymorpha]|uniref:Uncharacterized protein n=1 Tax=Dreissena polymorpha TaxID=45954 RepID=A0A9D4DSD7_DREPO|nr:hypothetical protein DPMN_187866 [Dreissena polymorpha]
MGQREVIEMIKSQIIAMIYTGDRRKVISKLVHQILERETCIVTLDGLNEWADVLHKYVVPLMANCHLNSVVLITSRPWKLADERISDSEIERLIELEGITDPEKLTKNIMLSLHSTQEKTAAEFFEYVHLNQLNQFLSSPWLQTLLVSLWMNNNNVNGSLCEINSILLDLLFKKANAKEGYFKKGTSFQCFFNTSYIEPQNEILNALAKAVSYFMFSSNKSLVFSKAELRNFISEEQLDFCLDAGLLTIIYNSTVSLPSPIICFVHETIQEFLAAIHIANSKTDEIESLLIENKHNVLEMSQILIYICGLDCVTANEMINRLTDDDFFNDIGRALKMYIRHFDIDLLSAFNTDYKAIGNIQKYKSDERNYNSHILALAFLFQRMMIAGFNEARASGQKDIRLKCRDFIFNEYLNESESNALRSLLMLNTTNVRTLILESNVLETSELLAVLQQSMDCLERVKARVTPEIHTAFYNLKLQELNFIGKINVSLISDVLSSLSKLKYLYIEDSTCNEEIHIPATLRFLDLRKMTCTVMFLQRLLEHLSLLKHNFVLEMCDVNITDFNKHIHQSELLPIDMSNICINVKKGNHDLYSLLSCTPVVNLRLLTADDAALASDILHLFSKLKSLYLRRIVMGHCALRLPASLHCINFGQGECSSEWLYSLLINLSALDHHVECQLWNFVVQSRREDCGADSNEHLPDLRSKLLACDMSNIEILVENGRKELFEILRDTSLGILSLRTADSVSQLSDILPTLIKLKNLYLKGFFVDHCDFQMPASLQCISLQTGECSSEWLCSLLINLCALGHPVKCELWSFQVQSCGEDICADSNIHLSDLRSKLLECDMSNIEILVENGNKQLFEIFRDTSIGILSLRTAKFCIRNIRHSSNTH